MGGGASVPVPARPAPAAGKTRVCVSGFKMSHNVGLARKTADAIAAAHPDRYETWYYFAGADDFRAVMAAVKAQLNAEQRARFADHRTAPFVWLEKASEDGGGAGAAAADDAEVPVTAAADGVVIDCKGPGDAFRSWALEEFPEDDPANAEIRALAGRGPGLGDLFFDNSTPGTAPSE